MIIARQITAAENKIKFARNGNSGKILFHDLPLKKNPQVSEFEK